MEVEKQRSRFLDIGDELCPLTFVKTRIALDQMPSGTVLEVRLADGEARLNVPRAAAELGHLILGIEAEPGSGGRFYRLLIQKV